MQAYDEKRVAYDAFRRDYEHLQNTNSPKLASIEKQYLEAYNNKCQARDTLMAKLSHIENTKSDILKKELLGLSNALEVYLGGNQSGFADSMEKLQAAQARAASGAATEAPLIPQ